MNRLYAGILVLVLTLPQVCEAGTIAEREVRDALLSYVREHGPTGVDLERWQLRKGDPLPIQGTILGLDLAPGARWRATTPMRMRIQTRAGGSETLWITAYLRRARTVVVACRTLPIGYHIGARDVRTETKVGWKSHEELYQSTDDVVGRKIRRPVSKGACVKSWHLGEGRNLRRGNTVVIVAQVGAVRVQAPGQLLESGNPGDRVRVLNVASGREVYATVLDAQTVSVSY
jgi:flagella basal body P-ring formation protein FlgA